jgi:hypothetical protein
MPWRMPISMSCVTGSRSASSSIQQAQVDHLDQRRLEDPGRPSVVASLTGIVVVIIRSLARITRQLRGTEPPPVPT